MAYEYRETPHGPLLVAASCDEHPGAVLLTLASAERNAAITICVARDSVDEVTEAIDAHSWTAPGA